MNDIGRSRRAQAVVTIIVGSEVRVRLLKVNRRQRGTRVRLPKVNRRQRGTRYDSPKLIVGSEVREYDSPKLIRGEKPSVRPFFKKNFQLKKLVIRKNLVSVLFSKRISN